MTDRVVFQNGEFVPADSARISVTDGGWLHGAGLFETMRAENGRVFRLDAHMTRLLRSARKVLRPMESSDLPTGAQLDELLERNGLTAARVRLTVTAGSLREAEDGSPSSITVCATADELKSYPLDSYERGVAAVISPYRQGTTDPLAGHKTTCFLPRLLALRDAGAAGCLEAIWFTTENHLAEGSISNVFVVRDGVLDTPPIDTPVLPGIARSVVLSIAAEQRIEVRETPLGIDDLLDANEVFLTNTIMQVMPVVRVEKKEIGDGRVGPMSRRLFDAYREVVRKECFAP